MRQALSERLIASGVSSQDVTDAPGGQGQKLTTTDTSKTQQITPTGKAENPSSVPTVPPFTVQGDTSTSKPGNPPPNSVTSPTTVRRTTPTSNPPSARPTSPMAAQGITSTSKPGNPAPSPSTSSPHLSQQEGSSTSSKPSTTTTAAASIAAQQQTSPPARLGSPAATTTESPIPANGSSPPATSRDPGTVVAPPPSGKPQGGQPSNQLSSTAASTSVTTSSPRPGLKNYSVPPSTFVIKQPSSSPSSPVSSTRPGSTHIPVTPGDGSVSTSKASLTLPPGSINNVSEAATTPTVGADQRSQDVRSVSTKPTSADQSPASTQPSTPAPGDQPASSSPGHQHPSTSLQNEVICKDQVQNNRPTIYLKEAKTCVEWRTASTNVSFFETFCSTSQHAFNASRETCTVMLSSGESHSQHWAVTAIVHLPLDPEKVLEELKEKKDKLEELGIANITYDKMEREIINDEFSTPLIITIVTLAGSLLLIAAIYGCCHQRFSQKKDQRLTEELQTMENGYHDNPTLEVMETSSEMQEKKVNLNGELGDSWIVPLDTLMKEDLEEEEDTHL
ncbi:podocalyxin isoform C [Patagioenas fasciata monilis]|uniref:Podocalyxin n=1 Tax=Patagioenas fasciata monilis TaxID=372326 RepID=A0A1V4JZG9_PATFA|nr:podocalyxin isoform C [Patagioenas fasciata monilis]